MPVPVDTDREKYATLGCLSVVILLFLAVYMASIRIYDYVHGYGDLF